MEKDRIQQELRSFYTAHTFYKGLLHRTCEKCGECWKNKPDGADDAFWNKFSEPYIGEKYNGDLLCVGLNIHKGGGQDVQEAMINGEHQYKPGVKSSLLQGKKQINFREGMEEHRRQNPAKFKEQYGEKLYGGTSLWYKIAIYAKVILDGCDVYLLCLSS